MDPLSFTANILTVLQATNSVIHLCYEFRAALQQAPWSLTRIVDEFTDLRNVLESLEQLSERPTGSCSGNNPKLRSFQLLCEPESGPLARCLQEVLNLEGKILGPKGITRKFSKMRAMVQVLGWQLHEDEATTCLQRIHRCKSTIQLALTADEAIVMLDIKEMTVSLTQVTGEIEADVSRLLERISTRELDDNAKALTNWLSPATTWERHDRVSNALCPGTCEWVLHTKIYQQWQFSHRSFAWLSGFPGCGKTVLFSNIVESLQAQHPPGKGNICFAFFYCDFRDQEARSAINVIGSLVSQICSQVGPIPDLENAFASSRTGNAPERRPSYSLLRDILVSLTRTHRIMLLVDAVDECEDPSNVLDFLLMIREASENLGNISIMLTARPNAEITEKLAEFDRIRLEARTTDINNDIGIYINHRLATEQRMKWLKDAIKSEIHQTLSSTSAGMFRVAQCTLDAISTLRTVRSIKLALKEPPQGLSQMYEAILAKVPAADVVPLRKILLWLSFSVMPMKLDELHSAVAIEQDLDELDEDACLSSPQDVLHMCGSLVDISDQGHVRLAHLSVRDYLLSDEICQGRASAFALEQKSGNREMALDCFTYLSFRDFQSGPCETSTAFTARIDDHPFLRHASISWTYYLRKADLDTQLDDRILGFFSEERRNVFMSWVQVLNAPSNFKWDLYPAHATSLYYASSFGLDFIVQHLIDGGANLDAPGSRFGGTALHGAVLRYHTSVADMLLQAGASASRADFNSVTPLHTAAAHSHVDSIELLLARGASVTARDRGGETPMDWAIKAGQQVSQQLLAGAIESPGRSPELPDQQVWQRSVNYFPSDWYEHRSGLDSSIVVSVSIGGPVSSH